MKNQLLGLLMLISIALSGQHLPQVYNTGIGTFAAIIADVEDFNYDSAFIYYTENGKNFIVGKAKWQPNKKGTILGTNFKGGSAVTGWIHQKDKDNPGLKTGLGYNVVFKLGIKVNGEYRVLNPYYVWINEDLTKYNSPLTAQPMTLYHIRINSNSIGDKVELSLVPFLQWKYAQKPIQINPEIVFETTPLKNTYIDVNKFGVKYLEKVKFSVADGYYSTIKVGTFYDKEKWYQKGVRVNEKDLKKGIIEVELTGQDYTGGTCIFTYFIKFPKAK